MGAVLTVEMLGGFRVLIEARSIDRFPTQKAAALLAYLAYYPKLHSRDVLVDMLWRDAPLDAGRASLSQALSMLRRQLEPPGVPTGSVIVATKTHVGICPDSVETDVGAFHRALRLAKLDASQPEQIAALRDAADLYRGELLPGFYEDWVLTEQCGLANLYVRAVESLIERLADAGDLLLATEYARRAVTVDPFREASHCAVMRLCAAAGRRTEALAQFRALQQVLDQLGAEPSSTTLSLAKEIERTTALPQDFTIQTLRSLHGFPLPRGAVTFLAVDVSGATDREEPPTGADWLDCAAYKTVLRDIIADHQGQIVHETNDTILAAFDLPTAALTSAVECQKAQSNPSRNPDDDTTTLHVRLALHTDEVKLADGEYQGSALQYATRIRTAAHSGQIVASETFAMLINRDLPAGVRLTDLGLYRLRDSHNPDRFYQVWWDGMPQTEFPPLNIESGYQSNLPAQFTRFFGRDTEIAQVSSMLLSRDARLVTVTGIGGTGKTRLALEVASRMLESFAGAVWFVTLVDLNDPQLIAGTIAASMHILRSTTLNPLDQAVEALNRQPSLLILDNLEQFVEEAGRIVRTLLERIPMLTCLVTSRRSLSLTAEREFALSPLMTPNGEHPPERLRMCESVKLFLDRAQAVKPDFQVTRQNAPAVAELCDRLEGIPLAIELAAARAGTLAPSQMLQRLENRFDFLVDRKRNARSRHYTLRAVMEWSYELLPKDIQGFFCRLSVFRGGWTLEAAEAVCADPNALMYLEHLRECSLVRTTELGTGMRYQMLETVREYCEARLQGSSLMSTMQERRLDWCVKLAETAETGLKAPDQLVWLDQLEAEHSNLRAALEWAGESSSRADLGLRLAASLCRFWDVRGYWAEGLERLSRALGRTLDWKTADRAKALNAAGHLACRQGDYLSARKFCEESLVLQRALDDRWGIAAVLNNLGNVAHCQVDYPASLSLHNESLAIRRDLGDREGIAGSLNNLGLVARDQGDYMSARTLLEESLKIKTELGHRRAIALSLGHLGTVLYCQNDYEAARALCEESLAIRRELGDREGIATALTDLGLAAFRLGEIPSAQELLQESLALKREVGDRRGIAATLEGLAEVMAALGDALKAVTLWAAADQLREAIGAPLPPIKRPHVKHSVDAVRTAAADDRAFDAAWKHGRDLALNDAIEVALRKRHTD